jgi:hypothetical protein
MFSDTFQVTINPVGEAKISIPGLTIGSPKGSFSSVGKNLLPQYSNPMNRRIARRILDDIRQGELNLDKNEFSF